MMLCHGGVLKSGALSKAQYMSSYWSAITHDYEHGGLNNDFLIKTAHPLAIAYNDQSPLENHHCAAAAKLLFEPDKQYIQVHIPACLTDGNCMMARQDSGLGLYLVTAKRYMLSVCEQSHCVLKR